MQGHSGASGRPRRRPDREERDVPSADGIDGWFAGRLPEAWFDGPPEVTIDRDEILVVGRLTAPDLPEGAEPASQAAAEAGRIQRFREETREQRMRVADEAERRFGRKVAWGAQAGDTRHTFTSLAIPVMTRLRQPERQVLDTLVESGVARSRSEALAWCVRLVGSHSADWLEELRGSLEAVQRVRSQGPA